MKQTDPSVIVINPPVILPLEGLLVSLLLHIDERRALGGNSSSLPRMLGVLSDVDISRTRALHGEMYVLMSFRSSFSLHVEIKSYHIAKAPAFVISGTDKPAIRNRCFSEIQYPTCKLCLLELAFRNGQGNND